MHTLVLVRHGKAMLRRNWTGRDQERRLTSRGRRQAKELIAVLDAYGVTALKSSSSTRCAQTLTPYAKFAGLDVGVGDEPVGGRDDLRLADLPPGTVALEVHRTGATEPDVQVVEQGQHGFAQLVQVTPLQGLGRLAVPRQIEVQPRPGGKGVAHFPPLVAVAGKTVQKHQPGIARLAVVDSSAEDHRRLTCASSC